MFKCPFEGSYCEGDYLGQDGLCDADTLPIWERQEQECKDAKSKVNAAFIVRACNNHEKLVEICKEVMKELIFPECSNKHSKLYEKLQQAIQSATEKEG